MIRLRGREPGPTVLSLNVRATMPPSGRTRGRFEVLVRHLYERMLHNEALGEDAATRAAQLLYAIALPGVLVALFLFAAYHQPVPERARTMWAQRADHLFYVTYALVVLGLALISQWEMLFPDLLDAQVLSSLPIRRSRLLLARVAALGCFLCLAHVGTNGLGALFFAGAADLPVGFWHHLAAHTIAVTMSAVATVCALVALQSLLVCFPGRRFAESLSTAVRSAAVLLLLTILFLFPLTAHTLPLLVQGHSIALRVLPPMWFLGVYECVLYGHRTLPVFHDLARTAVWSTVLFAVAAAAIYPAAHAVRLARLIEGPGVHRPGPQPMRRLWRRALHLLVRRPGERALFHFTAQTLWRLPRLQLSLAMYGGVCLALLLSGLLTFAMQDGRLHLGIAESGVRVAAPVLAFWVVAGLRGALASPVAKQGRWLFEVTGALARDEEIRGAEMLAGAIAASVTLPVVALLSRSVPEIASVPLRWMGQIVLAAGLSVVLCDLFFLRLRTVPFTVTRPAMTRELPLTLLLYFMVFPAFTLYVAGSEPWVEASGLHLLITTLGFVAAHLCLRRVRASLLRTGEAPQELIYAGLQLRE